MPRIVFCYSPQGSPQGISGTVTNYVLKILSFLTLNNYNLLLFGLPLDLLPGTNICMLYLLSLP